MRTERTRPPYRSSAPQDGRARKRQRQTLAPARSLAVRVCWLSRTKTVPVITWGVLRETSSCFPPLPSHNISRMSYHARRGAPGGGRKTRVTTRLLRLNRHTRTVSCFRVGRLAKRRSKCNVELSNLMGVHKFVQHAARPFRTDDLVGNTYR